VIDTAESTSNSVISVNSKVRVYVKTLCDVNSGSGEDEKNREGKKQRSKIAWIQTVFPTVSGLQISQVLHANVYHILYTVLYMHMLLVMLRVHVPVLYVF
jgi:hypothetical protein